MNESLYLNKICFQEYQDKPSSLFPWISLILSVCFVLICIFEIQLSTPIKAIYDLENKSLKISCLLDDINKLSQYENIVIDSQKYPFQIQNISEIFIDEKTLENYQIIDLESPKSYRNHQVIQIYLLDKKEKIIKKIKKLIQ